MESKENIMNTTVSVPSGAWVMVADHSKAILCKNNGSPAAIALEVRRVFESTDNPRTNQQGTDRPGKVFSGSHHSAVEQTDWHAIAGQQFLAHVTDTLAKLQAEEKFDALVLVAPPKALSEVREAMPESLAAIVVGSLDRDLTHLPVADIALHLAL
jgi:protein required for attachment to host cells